MKKLFKTVILVVLCVLTVVGLAACNKDNYKKMNKVVGEKYAQIGIAITATKGSDTLNSTVTVANNGTSSTISYNLEQFTVISADSIPDSYKKTSVGSVVITDGAITSQTGDKVEGVDFSQATALQFHFAKDYFANAEVKDKVFTADVLNARDFTGNTMLDCTGMKVVFDFGADTKVLTVTYTDAAGVAMTLVYTLK